MACVDQLHINDVGTSLEFLMKECEADGTSSVVNITDSTARTVRFQKPDGTTFDRAGVIFTGGTNGDGTDGIVQYITVANDIDTIGRWKMQAIISFPDGSTFHSSIVQIKVLDNL